MRKTAFISVLAALLVPGAASAAPGDLDPSFGSGGLVVSEVDKRSRVDYGEFQDVVGLEGSRVLAIGTTYRKERDGRRTVTRTRALVARFRANGHLDRSFSKNGIALINTKQRRDDGAALAVLGNGKILAGFNSGSADHYGARLQMAVARLRPNGRLDRRFGRNGVARTRISRGGISNNEMVDLTTDRAGRPVAVGSFQKDYEGGPKDISVIRLSRSGRLDSSLAGGGKLVLSLEGAAPDGSGNIGLEEEEPSGVAIDSQNRIVIAGSASEFIPPSATLLHGLVRLTVGGDLDDSFSDDGWRIDSEPEFGPAGVAVVADDAILVGGGDPGDFGVLRFDADGTPDEDFGEGGVAHAGLTGVFGTAFDVSPGGQPIVAGRTARVDGRSDLAVARFTPTGSLDTSFGNDGSVRTSLRREDVPNSVSAHPDGRIILAGRASTRKKTFYALARYLP